MAKRKGAEKEEAPEPKKRGRPQKEAAKTGNGSAAVVGFEQKLWQAADKMRNNMDAAEYKHVVLGLIFTSLERATFDDSRKTRVLRFVHTYSHAGHIQDVEEEPWGLAETSAVLNDIHDLIQHEDPNHYGGMVRRIEQGEATA